MDDYLSNPFRQDDIAALLDRHIHAGSLPAHALFIKDAESRDDHFDASALQLLREKLGEDVSDRVLALFTQKLPSVRADLDRAAHEEDAGKARAVAGHTGLEKSR